MIIACFVNGRYRRIAENWLAGIERLGLTDKALLVTLDDEARSAFAGRAVRTSHRPVDCAQVNHVLYHRTLVIDELLRKGNDVVHSDADAVWMRSPMSQLFDEGEDMVFSQGTTWPPKIFKRRGFVLCCGFYMIRATRSAIAFFSELVARINTDEQDQETLNYLVDDRFKDWQISEPYQVPIRKRHFIASRQKMRSENGDLRIAVLPHHLFPRLMPEPAEVIVGHPFSGKTAADTETVLKEKKLWLI